LSYTVYDYTNLRLEKANLSKQESLSATLETSNAGAVAGETVVQCYIAVPDSRVARAPKDLKAFQRVSLEPGEKKTVQINIPISDLAYYDPEAGWMVEPSTYTLIIGQHSLDDQALQTTFSVN